jgi:putative ABC transport system permease protein
MSWIPDRYRELRTLLRPDRLQDDVDEELAFHIEERIAELRASGLDESAAREQALRRFGDVTRFRAETCEIDRSTQREQRRMEIFDAVRRETQQSLRALLRTPVFTTVAVLTLGLGIGATTAIFSLLDSIVLRPLPYPEPDRLVQISHAVPGIQEGQEWGNSIGSYLHYREANASFQEFGAAAAATFTVSGEGEAERMGAATVSESLFRVLGARAAVGRLFTAEEDRPGEDRVVLLSHEIWQSRYSGDPDIIGRTININAVPIPVVGVLQPGFSLPEHETHFWLPLQMDPARADINQHLMFTTYARLLPGVSPEAAQADLQRLLANLPELYPNAYGGTWLERTGFAPRVHALRDVVLGGTGGRAGIDRVLWMLLGAVSLVLLIACANVANLMMVRAEARRRELTVRSALGAERAHLALNYLTESMLFTAAAALLGIVLAYGGIQLLLATAPATLPRLADVGLSANALIFAIGVSLATGIIFGLGPAIRSSYDFGELRESGRGATVSRRRQFARNGLVVGQVALALILLAAGGLMLQSFLNLRSVQTGLDGERVLTFNVTLPWARYQDEAAVFQFQRDFVEGLQGVPGVEVAGATSSLPLAGAGGCSHTVGENSTSGGCVPTVFVLPGYFEALGIHVRGATPTWSDLERRADGAVISQALAERLWPGEDPVGRRLISFQDGPPWYTVVGVAADVRADGLDQPPVQAVYYPVRRPDAEGYWGPNAQRSMGFVVRTTLDRPELLTPAVRGLLREMDPEVPLSLSRTMPDVIMSSPTMARTSFTMLLLGLAAFMALFLSAVGLYGVIAYLVGRRRAEIGVRMALGARVSEVARMVVLQSVRLAALGIVVGVGGALILTSSLQSLLYDVVPADPFILALVSIVLLMVAVMASAVPASRAARTDPSEALRAD